MFRPQVVEAQNGLWLGQIRLAQPVSAWLVVGISLVITACLVALISFGSIQEKARVAGVIVPANGTISIMASDTGTLLRCHVKEGQHVSAGQNLFELSAEHQMASGELTELIAQQLSIRKQTLESERRARLEQDREKKAALDERLANLQAEGNQLEQEIDLAKSRKALAQKSVERYETLRANDYVSPVEAQQKQEELIDVDARLGSLLRTKVQLEANRLGAEADKKALAAALEADMAQLRSSEASLNEEVAENQGRKTNFLVAPQAGTVTTITYQPGQTVHAGEVLASLVPDASGTENTDANLEVHLYAPSGTIGFVEPGQAVQIRLQAYPYQRFGLQGGVIVDVSKTPFAPGELPANIASTILSRSQQSISGASNGEGLYRIKVRLNRQTIAAYGEELELKPGMTLEADIVQDERKIWEWIAEPLLAAERR